MSRFLLYIWITKANKILLIIFTVFVIIGQINLMLCLSMNNQPTNNSQKYSISIDYFHFVFVICSILIIVYVWVSWLNYNKIESTYNQDLEIQFNRIDREITQSFDFLSYVFKYVEKQIADSQDYNLESISKIFVGLNQNYFSNNLPPITNFSWSDNSKSIIINSKYGIMQKPIDLSYRRSMRKAEKDPNNLQFDSQTIGTLSGKSIIPIVKGIKQKEKFLGYITAGMSVSDLKVLIDRSLDLEKVSYIILGEDGNVITYSIKGDTILPKSYFSDLMQEMLPQKLHYSNIEYKIVHKNSKYPFIVAIGYYPNVIWDEIKSALKTQIMPFIIMGFLFIAILYEFKHRIFRPIKILSDAANEISLGNLKVEIPEFQTYEIDNFSMHLKKIKSYISDIIEIDQALQQAKLEAEGASRAKTMFLANMSHELRTPLFTVTGYAEAIYHQIYGKVKDEYINAAKNIYRAGMHLLELINDIMDLSRAETGNVILNEQEVDLEACIRNCIDFVSHTSSVKNIFIGLEFQNYISTILCDELRMRQIITNIIGNAIKFTNFGGEIKINVFIEDSYLCVSIEDNGQGVSAEEIPIILSEFGQAKNAFSRKDNQGSGLGIPIAIKFTKLHDGILDFRSTLGKGTTVVIKLPASRIIDCDIKIKDLV